MMPPQYYLDGVLILTTQFVGADGNQHFLDGLPLMSDEDLATIGVERREVEIPAPTLAEVQRQIDLERDRRISGGFAHAGHTFQSRQSDRENILGAAISAQLWLGQGGEPGSLRWADPEQDFVWIAADNQLVPMSALDVLALYQRGLTFKASQTFHARGLKDHAATLDPADLAGFDWRPGWPE